MRVHFAPKKGERKSKAFLVNCCDVPERLKKEEEEKGEEKEPPKEAAKEREKGNLKLEAQKVPFTTPI